jgi:hypothetical protein
MSDDPFVTDLRARLAAYNQWVARLRDHVRALLETSDPERAAATLSAIDDLATLAQSRVILDECARQAARALELGAVDVARQALAELLTLIDPPAQQSDPPPGQRPRPQLRIVSPN